MKTTLFLQMDYDPNRTDPESLAVAMDRLLETACSIPGILDEYGNPTCGEFFVVKETAPGTPGGHGDTAVEQARQVVQTLLDCPKLNLDELDEISRQAMARAQDFLAGGDLRQVARPTGSFEAKLAAMCQKVAESAGSWADCSDLRQPVAVFREIGEACRELLEERSRPGPARFVLYDFDANELATTCVYDAYSEAAEDADQFDNVLVLPLAVPVPDLGPGEVQ